MTLLLPQHDPAAADRRAVLAERQSRYVYSREVLAPFVLFESLPAEEVMSLGTLAGRLGSSAALPANLIAAKARRLVDRWDELQDFEDLFALIERPAIIDHWRSDRAFAEQRVAGVEARTLRRVDRLPDHFGLSPAHFQAICGEPLDQALAEGRVTIADYALLDGIAGGAGGGRQKHLWAPIAAFLWRPSKDPKNLSSGSGGGALMPVAIQLDQRPSPANLYSPQDAPFDWLMARSVVQSADYTLNMLGVHVGRMHLGYENVAMACARCLGDAHPIGALLRPHLWGMLAQDDLARRLFLNEDGYIDLLFAPSLAGSIEIAARSYRAWDVGASGFHADLRARGLDDPALLPHYPYRDDGALVWAALCRYVHGLVDRFYPDAAALTGDLELRAFLAELGDPVRGNLRGIATWPIDPATLADLLSELIFAVGPVHASFNFRQREYATFAPNLPMALYAPMPPARGVADASTLLRFLPSETQALRQIEICHLLTATQPDTFGVYRDDHPFLADPRAQALVSRLQEELAAAEVEIEARNAERIFPYTGMLPSKIPNGASV